MAEVLLLFLFLFLVKSLHHLLYSVDIILYNVDWAESGILQTTRLLILLANPVSSSEPSPYIRSNTSPDSADPVTAGMGASNAELDKEGNEWMEFRVFRVI